MARRVVITGGTGFIGKTLSYLLVERGYEVVVLSRSPERASESLGGLVKVAPWDGTSPARWLSYADGAFAIVNLAGDNIASARWSEEKKKRILSSRLDAGAAVSEAVRASSKKPAAVIQASAVGYYGSRGEELLDESSSRGYGFLSDVCESWESSTADVAQLGVRHVVVRSALVLGARGGFLDRLVPLFRRYMGGVLGKGIEWMPWIHIRDEVAAIAFLIEREDLSGAFNLSSPNPVRSKEFYLALARSLRRPAIFRVPPAVLRLALGEMADGLILAGERVVPRRLFEAGFSFGFPGLEDALKEALA